MPGKEKEFKKMYHLYFDKIYGFLYWQTRDKMLAEDLTGEVFTRAWQKMENFSGRYPQAWLYTIARNLLTDHWRAKRPLPLDEDFASQIPDERASAAESLDASSEAEKLKRALAKLPDRVRQVIIMRFLNKASAKDTARQMGLSEANVRVLQHRGLKQLRNWYGNDE